MAVTPSAQYSVTLRVEMDSAQPGLLGRLTTAIGEVGGDIGAIDLVGAAFGTTIRELVVNASDQEHADAIVAAAGGLDGVTVLSSFDRTFRMHQGGKIAMTTRVPLETRDDLSVAYMPGVARVCGAIAEDRSKAFDFTLKRNMVAVITNGTAVLGLGDIGAAAGMPVMEGKAMLFKEFGGVDSYPICIDSKDADVLVRTITAIAPAWGGINLEDIAAPVCFEVEDRLKETLDIPVFHDDQHGTAVVVLAALLNALKITGDRIEDLKVVVSGVGASGVACSKILMNAGVRNLIGCDSRGAIYKGRTENMNFMKDWYAEHTNPEGVRGGLTEAIRGANLFLGLSGPGTFSVEQLKTMAKDPIVFAMANPTPEIMPEVAAPHVRVMATGRSDYPNQINNVLAFPGIFKGALACRATQISEAMKVAAAEAIAGCIPEDELNEDYIIPSVFNRAVAPAVAAKVIEVAQAEGLARRVPTVGDEA
ncbi:NAD-dependent malic enzyme [Miltoncostaea marina]|uniref:NAD-dependent malic enzyme n=1 Tax=Miltoncostaea marina TaxID=2843215 RepID=UPI001FE3658E|nr:NAD-dependent malic enzyme [Miltoncostaea marina]